MGAKLNTGSLSGCVNRRPDRICAIVVFLVMVAGCGARGHSEYQVGSHSVVVSGCTSNTIDSDPVRATVTGNPTTEQPKSTITCDNTNIVVTEDTLQVDGKSYGHLSANDSIQYEAGKVSINSVEHLAINR